MSFPPTQVPFYAVAASTMAYGYFSLGGTVIDAWIRNQYGGHFQYLTMQGLALAWLTMVTGLVIPLFPSAQIFRSIKRTLSIVALPLAVVISSIYWTLILLFPMLIMQHFEPGPSSLSHELATFRLPLSVDLALHAIPVLTLLADFVLFEDSYSRKASSRVAPIATSLFTLWYGWWVEHCAKHNDGRFPYPFLTHNPFEVRVGIYICAATLAISAFWIINRLHPNHKDHVV